MTEISFHLAGLFINRFLFLVTTFYYFYFNISEGIMGLGYTNPTELTSTLSLLDTHIEGQFIVLPKFHENMVLFWSLPKIVAGTQYIQ